jgi:transposase
MSIHAPRLVIYPFLVYVLKDDLKALWGYRHAGYAKRFWEDWRRRAMSSRI